LEKSFARFFFFHCWGVLAFQTVLKEKNFREFVSLDFSDQNDFIADWILLFPPF